MPEQRGLCVGKIVTGIRRLGQYNIQIAHPLSIYKGGYTFVIDRKNKNAIISVSHQSDALVPGFTGRTPSFPTYIVAQNGGKIMRPLLSLLLLVVCLMTACQPVLPPEALAVFAPDRVQLTQSVASALKADEATSPFITLYPDLRSAPAPNWLRPATRVTYNFATATFARTQDDPTPSGAGLIQYDIIAQNRRNVVFLSTLFNSQIEGQGPTPLSHQIALPGVGEFWFSPEILENAESAASQGFSVTRMPLVVEGVEYDVVRMQSISTTNQGSGEDIWAFDVQTGILVMYRQALYRLDGSQHSGTTMTLLGQRQIRLPWRNGTMPEWVEAGLEWQFSGSQTLDVGVGQPTALPMSSISRITRVGSIWSEHAQQTYLYGRDAGSSTTANGAMQLFGAYWLPPEALDVLETGTVLDQDPLTGIQTSVVQANRQTIVIAAAGPGYLTQLYYDARNGRLIALYLQQQTVNGALYTSLQAVQ